MATNNKKPTHTLRCGDIKATIWQNLSEKGPFYATTFFSSVQGSLWRVAQRHLVRSQQP